MSQFYARYVPPSKVQSTKTSNTESSPKRKRPEVDAENEQVKKRQKSTRDDSSGHDSKHDISKDLPHTQAAKIEASTNGNDILNRYRISEFAKSQGGEVEVRVRKKHTKDKVEGTRPSNDERNSGILKQSRKSTEQDKQGTKDQFLEQDSVDQQKHAGVLSKFRKAKGRSTAKSEPPPEDDGDEPTELHGLEPIPQPEDLEQRTSQLTYSTLPSWQADATTIKPNKQDSFEDLGISKGVLANLHKHDIRTAFPVQSTIIPMLLEQSARGDSDLCVSAATGSGKTLAYVIPIIEALRKKTINGLQAVIVVPTRELVKQVRDTCELCALGSNVVIVTAAGSKSLKSEQEALIERMEIYDPGEWQKQQDAAVDWSSFTLEEALTEIQDPKHPVHLRNFVVRNRIKANLLITTPGRLVDHLKNTNGFHLDDVRWLVIDEADRLLNESYQEWVDAVIPALKSRAGTKMMDEHLSHMRMDLPHRYVRKILLSATMTQDISKLNALELNEPKLVVLKSMLEKGLQQTETSNGNIDLNNSIDDTEGDYHLPTKLIENVITIADGSDKPLVLLKILREQIQKLLTKIHSTTSSHKTSSDNEPSTSESDSDSSTDEIESSISSSTDESSSDESTSISSDSADDDEIADAKKLLTKFAAKRPVAGHLPRNRTPRALVFARSTASATRLSRLLSLITPDLASCISTLTRSTASSASSRQALASFRSGKSTILIATDRASRGIDIPDLENVINYDIPGSALTYVHRVGRTARAGKEGQAWTLVEHREGRWFWSEIGGKGSDCKIKRTKQIHRTEMKIEDANLKAQYETALSALGEEVRGN